MRFAHLFAAILALGVSVPATSQSYFGSAEVVDGDTLRMGDIRFRLFGVDAVEADQTCLRNGVEWQCGKDAVAALRGITEGKRVICNAKDEDAYGRIVAVCTANRYDLSEQMARMGLAIALEQFSQDYVAAVEAAKSRKVGIWGSEFELPSVYRDGNPAIVARDRALLAEQQRRARAVQSAERQPSRQVYFRNCREARAAGVTPLYRGQPGYGEHMDGDGDGIACEPYRGR